MYVSSLSGDKMKELPKCAVKSCKNKGFILFGNKWICGECMCKIIEKKREENERILGELDDN